MADTGLATNYVETVAADGTATITITPTSSTPWLVTQVSAAQETAPDGATATARRNGTWYGYVIPTGDVLGGDPPLKLNPGDRLTITWELCTPGELATAVVQYDRLGYGE